jgi:hypothetical protein
LAHNAFSNQKKITSGVTRTGSKTSSEEAQKAPQIAYFRGKSALSGPGKLMYRQ